MQQEQEQLSRVQVLLRRGLAFPCSMCIRMWRATDSGSDVCDAGSGCGGPMAGMSFPLYHGCLGRESMAKFCFRCGRVASKLVTAMDGGYLGVCDKHIAVLSVMRG